MAFGDSTKQAATTSNKTFETNPIFIDLKPGIRIVRVLGEEVQFKEAWMEVPVKTKKGDVETTTIAKRPFILAVFNSETGYFEHPELDRWYDNPMSEYINEMDEEDAKRNAPKTRFAVNVLNRTPALKKEDGSFEYNEDGAPLDIVQILVQSGGKENGKHFLQSMLTAAEGLRNSKREKLRIDQTDLRIITKGTGIETTRAVMPDMNNDPLEKEYVLYDLEAFYQPWPIAALEEIVNGAEYTSVRDKYNIPMFPSKFTVEEDLPF